MTTKNNKTKNMEEHKISNGVKKNNKKMTNTTNSRTPNGARKIITSVVALALSLTATPAFAQWAAPGSNPPASNASRPINIGTVTQAKNGNLSVNGFSALLDSYFGANLSIGTAVLDSRLRVDTATNKEVRFITSASTGLTDVSVSGAGIAFSRASDGADNIGALFQYTDSGGNNRTALASRDDLVFASGGGSTYAAALERMRINSSGNIGIGDTNPQQKLSVMRASGAGSVFDIRTSEGTYWMGLNSRSSAGSWSALPQTGDHVLIYTDGSADTGALVIGPWSASAKGLRIDSSGNIGIGIASPGAKLEVAGTLKITGGTPGAGKVLTSDAVGLASWTTPAAGGVTSVTEGTGVSASPTTGAVVLVNTGVTSNVAGTGITVSSATGAVTINANTTYLQRRDAGMSTTCSGANLSIKTISDTGVVTCEADDAAGGTVTGSGTTNYVPKWTSGTALGNSLISDNGSTVTFAPATVGTVVIYNQAGASEGGEIKLTANNGTGYYIENFSGSLRGINSARSSGIWSWDQSGNLTLGSGGAGTLTSGSINMSSGSYVNLNGGSTYRVGQASFFDTVNSGVTSDPLEINYNTAAPTKICANVGCGSYSANFDTSGNVQMPGTVTGGSFSGAGTGLTGSAASLNAGTATTLIGDQTNWASYRTNAVANMLSWKNYGNNHVIFDASQGTSPTGSAVNNTNSGSAWSASYPTLMGWNGASTYGVRVDSARAADTAVNVSALAGAWNGLNYFLSNKGAASTVGANLNYALQAYSTDAGAAGMSFHRGGAYAVNMGLDPDNVFRIGGWSAGSNRLQLDMSGNLTLAGSVTGTAFYYSSDKTLKEKIVPLKDSLSKILKLEGVSFNWMSDGKKSIGIVAQDVEKVYPELVKTDAKGLKSVEYGNLVAPLIEAVKEQQKQIDAQQVKIDLLIEEIRSIRGN